MWFCCRAPAVALARAAGGQPACRRAESSERQEGLMAPAAVAPGAALHQRGLRLQDVQGLLQALDLGLTARLALLVRLGHRDAAVLDLRVVLHDCGILSVFRG